MSRRRQNLEHRGDTQERESVAPLNLFSFSNSSVILSRAKDLCNLCVGRKLVAPVPLLNQIPPFWIDGNDQIDFLAAEPALDLLLALDRVADIFNAFELYQPMNPILGREAGPKSRLVLSHSLNQIAGDAGVERLRSIRHDVSEVCSWRTWLHRSFAPLRTAKSRVVRMGRMNMIFPPHPASRER
jgi:hypothetical protein